MFITLMRHFKVIYEWKRQYTSDGFAKTEHDYAVAEVERQSVQLPYTYDIVLLSCLKRSKQTYDYINIKVPFEMNCSLDEIQMALFRISNRYIPTLVWLLMGRIHWILNRKSQPETRKESISKVRKLAYELNQMNKNCLIIEHGLRLRLLQREIRKLGFTGKGFYLLKDGEFYTYHKN